MKSVLFLSDIHLGCSPIGCVDLREEILVEFIKQKRDTISHLVLLGDVFEFWMEYRYYIPKYGFSLLFLLKELVDSGVEVHYVAGNHDFDLGTFFEDQIGIHCHENQFILRAQERKILCLHGDGMNRNEKGYLWIKKIIRSQWAKYFFRKLHPDLGMSLALWTGSKSRNYTDQDESFKVEYLKSARENMDLYNCDSLIHGHTHFQSIKNNFGKQNLHSEWVSGYFSYSAPF
jgi:UDP-2,3-diacylglucosamine hydrolase